MKDVTRKQFFIQFNSSDKLKQFILKEGNKNNSNVFTTKNGELGISFFSTFQDKANVYDLFAPYDGCKVYFAHDDGAIEHLYDRTNSVYIGKLEVTNKDERVNYPVYFSFTNHVFGIKPKFSAIK